MTRIFRSISTVTKARNRRLGQGYYCAHDGAGIGRHNHYFSAAGAVAEAVKSRPRLSHFVNCRILGEPKLGENSVLRIEAYVRDCRSRDVHLIVELVHGVGMWLASGYIELANVWYGGMWISGEF